MAATTDLGELVRARLAAKIEQGKRPSKADLEWLEATREPADQPSSVEKSRNAKGDTQLSVKVYHRDPHEAARLSDEVFDRQRARYPMSDGTADALNHDGEQLWHERGAILLRPELSS